MEDRAPSIARRLFAPIVVFAVFVVLALFSSDILGQFGADAISQTRRVAGYAVQIGIWIASAFLINRLVIVFVWDLVVARTLGSPVPRLLKDLTGAFVYLIALSGIVSFVFDKSVTGLWATSGAVGLVVGFALRSMILDVAHGLAVNIDRPYRIGDWIQLHLRQRDLFVVGNVSEINWRTTRLRTTSGNEVIVPNSVIGQTIITNFMRPEPHSRLELYFTLDYSVPSDRALRVLTAAVRAVSGGDRRVLESPKPKVRITEVNHLGVEYRIRYWVLPADLSPNRSRHLVITSVLEHLKQAGLTLAYPKRDIFTADMPARQLDGENTGDLSTLLRRIELFEGLDDDELTLLAERVVRREYASGDTLIQRGADGDSMFILVEGLVYVYADVRGDGSEVKVAQIVPGQFFGEMSLLTGEPRSATITAASGSVAYELRKDAITELLSRRTELAEVISGIVAERKLRNEEAHARADTVEQQARKTTVSAQILAGMRRFFRGVFE